MNYGELKTFVNQYLEVDETTFNANIGQFVRNAEDDIYRQVQFPDLSKTVPIVLSASNAFMPLPPDFLSPYYLAVTVSGEYQMMLSKDQSFIRETYPVVSSIGVPRFYAIYNADQILLGPTPDQPYTAELSYFYKPVSIVDGGDAATTWLSINGEAALLFGSIIQGYIYLKGDQDVMKQYMDQYDRAVSELKLIAEGRDEKDVYRSPDRRLPV